MVLVQCSDYLLYCQSYTNAAKLHMWKDKGESELSKSKQKTPPKDSGWHRDIYTWLKWLSFWELGLNDCGLLARASFKRGPFKMLAPF